MNNIINDPQGSYFIALIFGAIIGIYGAALGIMGSLDYFYVKQSRFSLLRSIAISSILFSFIITIIGFVTLAQGENPNLWYATSLPGMLGLVLFSSLFFVISRRNEDFIWNTDKEPYY